MLNFKTRRGSPNERKPFPMQLHHLAKPTNLRFTSFHRNNFGNYYGIQKPNEIMDVLIVLNMPSKMSDRLGKRFFRKYLSTADSVSEQQ